MAKFWCQPEGQKLLIVHVDDDGQESSLKLDVNGLSALVQIAAMTKESMLSAIPRPPQRIETPIYANISALSVAPSALEGALTLTLVDEAGVSQSFFVSRQHAERLSSELSGASAAAAAQAPAAQVENPPTR